MEFKNIYIKINSFNIYNIKCPSIAVESCFEQFVDFILLCITIQWCPEKCFPCEPGTVCKAGRRYECRPGTYSDGTGKPLCLF